jgi:hypothetical protein
VGWWALVGSQFVGFTGLAIFGRIGELIRPLLVSRRTGLSFSSQVAVVAVERIFDLGAFALIFSLNLALAPGLNALPNHELFHKVGYAIGSSWPRCGWRGTPSRARCASWWDLFRNPQAHPLQRRFSPSATG